MILDNIKSMTDDELVVTGTGKWYSTGRINVSEKIKNCVPFSNGQELVIAYNKETNELCLKPLKY